MLKAPDHQVAGHQAREGQLGPLVDDSGRFYKPLQNNGRGSKELAFYRSFFSDPRVPHHIRRFFPRFFGTLVVEASDGSGPQSHLVMEDLVSGLDRPSVADIKIGSRTWYPHAKEDYIAKCSKKDRETTSLTLGFRVSGLQIYDEDNEAATGGFWKQSKKQVQGFTAEDVRGTLRRFASSNPSAATAATADEEPDCAFAAVVYGGSGGILAQLLELKAWFEEQTIFHFYSASVLLLRGNGATEAARVKLVDFAHVFEGDGVIDHNFLGGLCSLIRFISEVLCGGSDGRPHPEKSSAAENGGQG
ncbi:unnamed protein product [Spirodela intermedia]|uniref:Inositol polyphosphate multikinase n=1 Tax=Spirodela intermedia TaxID=51605 RepID=A0A7I8JWK0_SPIIN|nr:unnamed protein product [Spirodela intermedia]CAA6673852.1 unnamed protein product [Spirodela intermedia]